MAHILIINDDVALTEMLSVLLESEGYTTSFCNDGVGAVSAFKNFNPNLVLLDVMLQGMSGIEICKKIRLESNVPIVMLTAKSDTTDVVLGIEAGADDYVAKPFKPKELLTRIKTRMRSIENVESDMLFAGDLEINIVAHQVKKQGEPLPLTPLEFLLLSTMARKAGKVFTREELLEIVWGYRHAADTRLVNVHIQRLRSKIETDPENPKIMVTVRGIGYRCEKATK